MRSSPDGGPRVSPRHRNVRARLVDEDQASTVGVGEALEMRVAELADSLRVAFIRMESLFFRDKPSRFNARKIAPVLTSRPDHAT